MSVSPTASGVEAGACVARTNCRICGSRQFEPFLDLGEQPLANALLTRDALDSPELRYPLQSQVCTDCGLVQLRHVVDPRILFTDYPYFSSGVPTSAHFADYVQELVSSFLPVPGGFVCEIASNDGHLLRLLQQAGARVLGVDPARNITAVANERGVPTIVDFFSAKLADDIRRTHGPAQLVIANNVVAHIDDHHDLVRGIASLLSDDGVFVMEAPHLSDMFERLTFDTIYHEHLSSLALRPLTRLFGQFGLEIFDVKLMPVQGVSLRAYVARGGHRRVQPSVAACLAREAALGLDRMSSYAALARRIEELKADVVSTVRRLKAQGKRIAGYGAGAKGNTILLYYGLGRAELDYVTDEQLSKIGKFMPGTRLPIADVVWSRQHPPDYYFLLAWNYKDVILHKEQEFVDRGGKFIMPIGAERIVPATSSMTG
ncbi:class I SAM-dependent methyltransferase [Candidatus Parcubacteria bacterium]|nr:class I SAM-dependent methyltransferase [Candidatus Parcubacteria bacterium]MBI4099019.1 class I SAM-dependent methyltransferase [Candidatus Parcubacteria bacterium]